MWLTPILPDLCISVYTYTTYPRMAPARLHARQTHMQAQTCVRHVVSAYCVYASTMREKSATKTVTYLQLETVMQSVAMLTADYRVMITENVVRHQVDAQYYPLGVWWLLQCPTLDSSKPRVYT